MFYGRNGFKKDRSGTAYHIEVDITGGACGIETAAWDGKTVPAATCPGYEDYTDDGRCFGRQTVRGAYASALKGGKYVDAEILQGICTGQGTEKDAYILGQDEVASWEETMHRIRDRPGQTYQCRIMQDCAGICIILDNRRCRKVHLVLAELIQKYKIRKPVRC